MEKCNIYRFDCPASRSQPQTTSKLYTASGQNPEENPDMVAYIFFLDDGPGSGSPPQCWMIYTFVHRAEQCKGEKWRLKVL